MVDVAAGPAAMVLTAAVARRFFLDGRSKLQIADEFGLSRFKIARLLDHARDTGMVHIDIRIPGLLDVDLSARLQERYQLPRVLVVGTTDDSPETLRTQLGQVAGELLTEMTSLADVLGVTWSRVVGAMARTLSGLPPTPVVQLTGAISLLGSDDSLFDIARDVARATAGPAYIFYAPMLVPDAAVVTALHRVHDVERAIQQIPRVTRALLGLGLCAPGHSVVYDAATEPEQEELRQLGAVAELAGVFLSRTGELIDTGLAQRIIAVSAEDLRRIPNRFVIAYDLERVPAAQAALASGLVTELVTHTAFAQALLLDQAP